MHSSPGRNQKQGFTAARLLLIGFETATSLAEVTGWIREYGLQAEVRITGHRDDMAACISALDVGVVSSLWSEAIARAAFEIMACGRPLIGTTVGVLPDLLSPEALVPPGDAGALAAKLNQVLHSDDFTEQLLATERVSIAQHTETVFLKQTEDLFQAIISSAPKK